MRRNDMLSELRPRRRTRGKSGEGASNRGEHVRITLVFPPQWVADHPYLSIPSLAGYIRQGGRHEVSMRDINLESYDYLLDPAFECCYLHNPDHRLHYLNVQIHKPGLYCLMLVRKRDHYQDHDRIHSRYHLR